MNAWVVMLLKNTTILQQEVKAAVFRLSDCTQRESFSEDCERPPPEDVHFLPHQMSDVLQAVGQKFQLLFKHFE